MYLLSVVCSAHYSEQTEYVTVNYVTALVEREVSGFKNILQ
jgi:hypothetical protein